MNHHDQERLLTEALERNAAESSGTQLPGSSARVDISYPGTDVAVEVGPSTPEPR